MLRWLQKFNPFTDKFAERDLLSQQVLSTLRKLQKPQMVAHQEIADTLNEKKKKSRSKFLDIILFNNVIATRDTTHQLSQQQMADQKKTDTHAPTQEAHISHAPQVSEPAENTERAQLESTLKTLMMTDQRHSNLDMKIGRDVLENANLLTLQQDIAKLAGIEKAAGINTGMVDAGEPIASQLHHGDLPNCKPPQKEPDLPPLPPRKPVH